jgi:AraC family transcriptional regulator
VTGSRHPRLERGRFFGECARSLRVGDLVLVDTIHPAGSRLPRHTHDHAYFCLNHGGEYTEDYGRRRRVCRAGMLVFHPLGETHSERHDVAVASLNVEIGPTWLQRLVDTVGPPDQPVEFANDAIAAAASQLLREFRIADQDSELAIESLSFEILAATVDGRHLNRATGAPRWLVEARELLHVGLHEPPTLRSLAKQAGVHPVHFAAAFRRHYGCSTGEYLRRRRLQFARTKLADTTLSLAQIASDCGFADQSHFTRAFKRFAGATPAHYRTLLAFKTG